VGTAVAVATRRPLATAARLATAAVHLGDGRDSRGRVVACRRWRGRPAVSNATSARPASASAAVDVDAMEEGASR
jgi:hypothetical protein